jgi:hypothetical protein
MRQHHRFASLPENRIDQSAHPMAPRGTSFFFVPFVDFRSRSVVRAPFTFVHALSTIIHVRPRFSTLFHALPRYFRGAPLPAYPGVWRSPCHSCSSRRSIFPLPPDLSCFSCFFRPVIPDTNPRRRSRPPCSLPSENPRLSLLVALDRFLKMNNEDNQLIISVPQCLSVVKNPKNRWSLFTCLDLVAQMLTIKYRCDPLVSLTACRRNHGYSRGRLGRVNLRRI